MGNQIPTVGPNNRQEPDVDGQYSLFQDQRQQSASAQTNLGFNTVSQNATNVPGASTERAAPNSAKSTTTSNVENTVKSIATDVQKLEGLEDVEETLERMDEKLGRLVKAEESEEKARKSKKRQEELPKNVSASEVKGTFASGVGTRAGQLAGAAGGAAVGAGIMAMLFGPKLVEDIKKEQDKTLKKWDEVQKSWKQQLDELLGTGTMIQDATAEEQIAAKVAMQSGAAGKALQAVPEVAGPVARTALKTGATATSLAAKVTTGVVSTGAKLGALAFDAAETGINRAGQTTTTDSRGRELTRNRKSGEFAKPVENTRRAGNAVDNLASRANAAKSTAGDIAKKVAGSKAGKFTADSAKVAAQITKQLAKGGAFLVAKALPLVGAGLGAGLSIAKMIEGDYFGAAAAAGGAVLSFVPGPGTAGAVGIGAYEMAREIYNNIYEQYPEMDPDSDERWPQLLDQVHAEVSKYVEQQLEQYKADKTNIKKAEDSGLYDKDWMGASEIDLDMAKSATTGQLESILRDDDLRDEDKASVQAILKERAEAVEQGNPLLVAPGSAADFEADQAAMDIAASTSWQREGKIDATRRKPATDDVEQLAMEGATGQQPIVNVGSPDVRIPKIDAPEVTVVVNTHDPMLNDDPFARNIGYG